MEILIIAVAYVLGVWTEAAFDLSGRAIYAWRRFREWTKFRA